MRNELNVLILVLFTFSLFLTITNSVSAYCGSSPQCEMGEDCSTCPSDCGCGGDFCGGSNLAVIPYCTTGGTCGTQTMICEACYGDKMCLTKCSGGSCTDNKGGCWCSHTCGAECNSDDDCPGGSCSSDCECTSPTTTTTIGGGGTTTTTSSTTTTTTGGGTTTTTTGGTTTTSTSPTTTSSTSTTIDSTPPSVTVSHSPSTVTQTDTVTIDATASDPGSGINEIRIYIDGNLNRTCSSSTCSVSIGPFPTGTSVSYHAEAEDNVGNVKTSPTKSFTVNCKGPDCISVSVSKDEFHLKPEEGDTLTVNLTSTSVNPEKIEVSVEEWDGDHEFRKSTCSHCGCTGCGYSGSGDKEEITLKVPAGGHSEVDLWFSPKRKKRPGRYVFNVKTEGA